MLRRKKHQRDAEDRGEQPARPSQEHRNSAVLAARNSLDDGESHQRPKHIHEWDKLQHDSQRQKLLKCLLHAGAKEIHNDKKR